MTLSIEEYKTLVQSKELAVLKLSNVDASGEPLEEGVDLFCQSAALHHFFKKNAEGEVGKQKLLGQELWGLKNGVDVDGVVFNHPEQGLLVEGYLANLTFLRCTALNEGLTLRFPGVFRTAELTNILNVLKRGIQEVYLAYLHPFDMTVRLSTKEYGIS